jgi:TDG/mug DNA glycosylase family protein
VGFTREQLEAFRGRSVPDLIGPGLRLLIVGINPGLWTAATQTHFCHPSNRFYPALRASGLIALDFDAATGMTDDDRRRLIARGIGITNLVDRATVRASEVTTDELRSGSVRLESTVAEHRPRVVAVAGVTAYRSAFRRPNAALGRQGEGIDGAELWVLPNPSGLNAHETAESLAGWFRRVGTAAGLL